MARSFEELVAEAEAAPVAGWDFSWLDGRAIEARKPGRSAGRVRGEAIGSRIGRSRQ